MAFLWWASLNRIFKPHWKYTVWDPEVRFIGILMSTKESQAVIPLADDESIVIRKVDEGLWIVKWDKSYYLAEAENQLSNTKLLWDGEIPIMQKGLSYIENSLSTFLL